MTFREKLGCGLVATAIGLTIAPQHWALFLIIAAGLILLVFSPH